MSAGSGRDGRSLARQLERAVPEDQEESLTGWFARTEQPEEFQSSQYHMNVDIADFIFGQRRF